MDQLRTALSWLKRQHFWVLSVLVPLIAIVCWWIASKKQTKLYSTGESTITTQFKSVQNLRSEPFHANETINEKQTAETKKQSESVAKLWQQLYDRQREHVLEWPTALSKEFRDYVDKLQFGADIRSDLRNHYQNYIEGHFPELPKQVEARVLETSGTSGPGGEFARGRGPEGGPGNSLAPDELQDENNYVCAWLAADQAIIRDELNFPQQPSSLRIWVTQEDLWVYHTLLDVIAKTNQAAGATRMSNAAVKTIYELAVGERAGKFSRTPNRLIVPPPVAATGGLGGPESQGAPGGPAPGPGGPGGPEMMGPGARGPGAGSGPMTEEQERAVLLWGRYLDAQGKPIPFGGGGATSGETPAAPTDPAAVAAPPLDLTAFGQEYKRLPVRMVLEMDQRWLLHLISVCASESLQIEVQEVRINTPDAGAGASGGPGGGPGSYRAEAGLGGGGAANFPEETGTQPFPSHPEIVNVIIQGTIYIFNKPNPTILQAPGEQPPLAGPSG